MNLNKLLPLTETTYYIMLSLLKPCHGYIIMQKVEELSNGNVRIAAGTLYGAIENLLKQKLISPVETEDKRRKVYTLTAEGRKVLEMDFKRIKHLITISENLLEPNKEV